jgi:formylglycine-generating enzyme required for sulfatase activity/mono/diheme cytochrome c family protein
MKEIVAVMACALVLRAGVGEAQAAEKVDFRKDVKPVLEVHCLSCHGEEKPKGALKLTTRAEAIKGGDDGTSLVPGKASESTLYTTTILPADHDDAMPPKGPRLMKEETERLRLWIEQGAEWPEEEVLKQVKKIDFVKDVQPILEFSCVACHREGEDKGKLRMDTRELTIKGGENGPGIVPFDSSKSPVYTTTALPPDHDDLMPPSNKGGPLPPEEIQTLKDWIDQGAYWPEGLTLQAKKKEEVVKDDTKVLEDVYAAILANMEAKTEAEMKPYKVTIPGTDVTFEMVPIKGGEFVMGSPEGEAGRKPDEGPQHKVKVEPFWMGKFEVTWNEYELFQFPEEEKKRRIRMKSDPTIHALADAVSRPTTPYVEMSFGMGKDGYPAISMTQHAANTYCKWLSAKVGQFFRLPTEAEWEYAARAGTTTAYSFGDDVSKLGEYAWFGDNSDLKYQKVGMKKPNPWGLHDMHGNVTEWCLDQYDPEAYKQFVGATVENPWLKATKPYPHVARGGSWDDDPASLRSAARRGSSPAWKQQDPQLPKSIWYLTDAQFLGFRIIRPLKAPPEAMELRKYWTSGVEKD